MSNLHTDTQTAQQHADNRVICRGQAAAAESCFYLHREAWWLSWQLAAALRLSLKAAETLVCLMSTKKKKKQDAGVSGGNIYILSADLSHLISEFEVCISPGRVLLHIYIQVILLT